MNRPKLDDLFEDHGREYRVTAITEHHMVGTLSSIQGEPSSADEIVIIKWR